MSTESEMKRLPKRWRERAKRIAPMSLPMQTKADALLECADELEAAYLVFTGEADALLWRGQ